ncbi:MAG TPA: hypothetical protein VHT21_23995 [Stellaceae bacterium]|nr:hypothetical protein [Stellaceae bacterium]
MPDPWFRLHRLHSQRRLDCGRDAGLNRLPPILRSGAGVGYADNNYTKHVGLVVNGLTALGQSVPNALSDFNTRGGPSFYNNQLPSLWWDPTVVVPGSP